MAPRWQLSRNVRPPPLSLAVAVAVASLSTSAANPLGAAVPLTAGAAVRRLQITDCSTAVPLPSGGASWSCTGDACTLVCEDGFTAGPISAYTCIPQTCQYQCYWAHYQGGSCWWGITNNLGELNQCGVRCSCCVPGPVCSGGRNPLGHGSVTSDQCAVFCPYTGVNPSSGFSCVPAVRPSTTPTATSSASASASHSHSPSRSPSHSHSPSHTPTASVTTPPTPSPSTTPVPSTAPGQVVMDVLVRNGTLVLFEQDSDLGIYFRLAVSDMLGLDSDGPLWITRLTTLPSGASVSVSRGDPMNTDSDDDNGSRADRSRRSSSGQGRVEAEEVIGLTKRGPAVPSASTAAAAVPALARPSPASSSSVLVSLIVDATDDVVIDAFGSDGTADAVAAATKKGFASPKGVNKAFSEFASQYCVDADLRPSLTPQQLITLEAVYANDSPPPLPPDDNDGTDPVVLGLAISGGVMGVAVAAACAVRLCRKPSVRYRQLDNQDGLLGHTVGVRAAASVSTTGGGQAFASVSSSGSRGSGSRVMAATSAQPGAPPAEGGFYPGPTAPQYTWPLPGQYTGGYAPMPGAPSAPPRSAAPSVPPPVTAYASPTSGYLPPDLQPHSASGVRASPGMGLGTTTSAGVEMQKPIQPVAAVPVETAGHVARASPAQPRGHAAAGGHGPASRRGAATSTGRGAVHWHGAGHGMPMNPEDEDEEEEEEEGEEDPVS